LLSFSWYIVGELRHINKLRYWPLEDVLHDKYEFSRETATTIASFLSPMLRLNPEKRAGAGELTHHRWLDNIVTQGEIDVIRHAEDVESLRRAIAESTNGISGAIERGFGLRPFEVDALKPVDDEVPLADEESAASAPHVPPTLAMPRPSSKDAKENAPRAPSTAIVSPTKPPGTPSHSQKRT